MHVRKCTSCGEDFLSFGEKECPVCKEGEEKVSKKRNRDAKK